MEPTVYLSGERLPTLPLADFKKDFKKYDKFDVGAVGEFDVAILMDQYAGTEVSKRLYPHWRGGYYYAVRPKGDASVPGSDVPVAVVERGEGRRVCVCVREGVEGALSEGARDWGGGEVAVKELRGGNTDGCTFLADRRRAGGD